MLLSLSHGLLWAPALLAALGSAAAQPDPNVTTIAISGPKPVAALQQAPAPAACTNIRTAVQLSNIRNNLAGSYCLTNDIDLGSIANFTPIGTSAAPFRGTLDGRGHVIRNLRINSASDYVGLFGYIRSATVKNVGLIEAVVTGTAERASVGGLVGYSFSGAITRAHVTGEVSGTAARAYVGGLVGESYGPIDQSFAHAAVAGRIYGTVGGLVGLHGVVSGEPQAITRSYATAPVTGGHDATVGGLVGRSWGSITLSYATGSVRVGQSLEFYAEAGGLVGESAGAIGESFATGPVRGGNNSWVGGLVGNNGNVGGGAATIGRAYSTGPVSATGAASYAGGLVGYHGTGSDDQTREAYAAGLVQAPGPHVGGLTGSSGNIVDSYWDTETSGQATSYGGSPRTTAQLQHALQPGFVATRWAITPDVSYPYLTRPGLNFASPLATVVPDGKIYTLLPISQLDPSQYETPPAHAEEASLATVYTIIARAIGVTDNVASLKDVSIDEYFWDDARQTATWRGPVTGYASLGPLTAIPGAQPLDLTNVIDPLRHHEPVIIRGRYRKSPSQFATHWMLATSFIVDGGGTVTAVVANDPWTGRQVRIDPSTKTVTSPTDFPLENFKVIGFRTVGGPTASAPAAAMDR